MNCLKCKIKIKYGAGKKGAKYQSLHTTEKDRRWNEIYFFCNDCVNDIISEYKKDI